MLRQLELEIYGIRIRFRIRSTLCEWLGTDSLDLCTGNNHSQKEASLEHNAKRMAQGLLLGLWTRMWKGIATFGSRFLFETR